MAYIPTTILLAGTLYCIGAAGVEQKTLRISAGEWPPYLSESIENHGPIAHLIKDIFAEEGYAVEFRFLPWPRAYAEAATGSFDATAIWMHKTERESDFFFSDPVLDEQFVFFHLKSQHFSWKTFQDLNGMLIGGGLEYSYGPKFDTYLKEKKVRMERVTTDQQNFGKLLRERITLYPQEINVGYAALRTHFSRKDVERITHNPKPLLVNQSFLMLPKSQKASTKLKDKFNIRLQQFRENGKYQKYFDDLQSGNYPLLPPAH